MTLSPLGIFSAAGAGGAPTSGFELISTTILGSSQPSVTFSNLGNHSSTYRHLQLRLTLRQDSNTAVLRIRLNGNSSNSYATHQLVGNGSSVSSFGNFNEPATFAYTSSPSSRPANVFSANVIDILDAYSSTKNKTLREIACNGVVSNGEISLSSAAWFNTASITSIELFSPSSNYVAGSRFSLYGIRG